MARTSSDRFPNSILDLVQQWFDNHQAVVGVIPPQLRGQRTIVDVAIKTDISEVSVFSRRRGEAVPGLHVYYAIDQTGSEWEIPPGEMDRILSKVEGRYGPNMVPCMWCGDEFSVDEVDEHEDSCSG